MKLGLLIPPSSGKRKIIRAIDCSHESKADYLWQPNDFMILSSLLEPEDELVFIDGTADAMTQEAFLSEVNKVSSLDILVFALSSVCWELDLDYFLQVKKRFPETSSFVIGDIFLEKTYREYILKECCGIIFQPYEVDLKEMANAHTMPQEETLGGICRMIHDIPFPSGKKNSTIEEEVIRFPRHEIFQKEGYSFPFAKRFAYATVTTLWGCPFSCSYCTDSQIPPVTRGYKSVCAELDYLANLGIHELFFADKTFGFPKENIFPLLEYMGKNHHFSWSCYFHPQFYTPELFDAMHKAGCHTIIIGIDSANLGSLKQYKRNVQNEKVDDLIQKANELNWNICADFILGLEHETEEDVIATMNYGVHLPIDFASFNIAAPLPGSDIREKAQREGKLSFGKEGYDTFGHEVVLENEHISVERLLKLRKKAILSFYLRFSYLLRRIKRTTSLQHFIIQFRQMKAMFLKSKIL
ncbi:MAG: radical SAM protein [Nitrospinae bacterium]|nr:radical SAM protein [Nitrospinota bacterium]